MRAFASFEPEPGLKFDKIYEVYSQRFQREDFGEEDKFNPKTLPNSYLTNPKEGDAFVYVSTIQRLTITLFGKDEIFNVGDEPIDEDAEKVENIPIHAFDVIIADECHRGYSTGEISVWRRTLDHFDAIKIGLTATPAAHTKAYFKDVVYRYEYQRAVQEGYLVDYDVVTIKSNVRMNGVFLNEGEQIGIVDPVSGTEFHRGANYGAWIEQQLRESYASRNNLSGAVRCYHWQTRSDDLSSSHQSGVCQRRSRPRLNRSSIFIFLSHVRAWRFNR